MKSETWIVFKTETPSDEGWEDRKLMPSGNGTNILWENWDCSGKLPAVGDRIRDYTNLSDPDNGITHGRDGSWVVSRVQHFSSFDTDERVVICYCQFQPIEAPWQPLEKGLLATELPEKITTS